MTDAVREEAFEISLGGDLYLRGNVVAAGEETSRKPVVIYVHGFKSFKDWGFGPYLTQRLAAAGYCAVRFNLSCNGVKERDFDELDKFAINTYSRELADLSALLGQIAEGRLPLSEQMDTGRIAVLGHSRGGGDSILFAAEHPEVSAVVTWNGIGRADLFDDAFKRTLNDEGIAYIANARTGQKMPIRPSFYEDLNGNRERFDIPAKLSALQTPVLSVQGEADSERLQQGFRLLRQAAPQQTFATIAEGTHTFGAVHPFAGTTPQLDEAIDVTLRFLQETLRTASAT